MGHIKGENPSIPGQEKRESKLIEEIKAGDEDAFVAIYQRYQKRLRAYTYVITHSREMAEEMVQEVFLKLWAGRKKLDPALNFEHYIFRVTRNQVLDHLRKTARNERLIMAHAKRISRASHSTQDTITFREYQRIIKEAVQDLSPKKRMIFELSRMEGKGNKEIATELNLSVKTVQNQLRLALQILKEKLQAADEITLSILLLVLLS